MIACTFCGRPYIAPCPDPAKAAACQNYQWLQSQPKRKTMPKSKNPKTPAGKKAQNAARAATKKAAAKRKR